jgi:two-component system nitrate/nitrite response regulator NarL
MPARILILEDQPDGVALLKASVKGCFEEPNITLAASLAAVRLVVDSLAVDKPFDYALIDLRLPDGLSIDFLASFKQLFPETQAIVTSLYDDDDLVFAALRAGADGYILKGDGIEQMQHALRKVILGEPPISPGIARKLMQQFRPIPALPVKATVLETESTTRAAESPHANVHLTAREQEVLALIGSGLMIKQAAARLGIGYHTVNDNIKSIYRKLGIRTRAQAAAEANRRGLASAF